MNYIRIMCESSCEQESVYCCLEGGLTTAPTFLAQFCISEHKPLHLVWYTIRGISILQVHWFNFHYGITQGVRDFIWQNTISCMYQHTYVYTTSHHKAHGVNLLEKADVALLLPRGLVAVHLTVKRVSFPVAIRWLTCPGRFVETKNSVLAIPTTDIVELT